METLHIALLGIIQGLTEFLPVSSSGHLVIFSKLFGLEGGGLFLNLVLHTGTLFAVILFFFKDLLALISSFRYSKNPTLYYIILASIPTAIIGLLIKQVYQEASSFILIGIFLIITGIFLFLTQFFNQGQKNLTLKKSLFIGISQGITAFPGISRSGATISTALFLGVKKEKAFAFSFLLSVPAIIGADILEFKEVFTNPAPIPFSWFSLILGFFIAFFTGLASLWILKKLITKNFFHIFGYYCAFIGFLLVIIEIFR